MVADDIRSGRLIPIMHEYRPVEMIVNALYPHRHHLSAKVRGFIDLLAKRTDEFKIG
jgi:DNA-binding transcriptional LysR family regulator